jgi:hypothetical protein
MGEEDERVDGGPQSFFTCVCYVGREVIIGVHKYQNDNKKLNNWTVAELGKQLWAGQATRKHKIIVNFKNKFLSNPTCYQIANQ